MQHSVLWHSRPFYLSVSAIEKATSDNPLAEAGEETDHCNGPVGFKQVKP